MSDDPDWTRRVQVTSPQVLHGTAFPLADRLAGTYSINLNTNSYKGITLYHRNTNLIGGGAHVEIYFAQLRLSGPANHFDLIWFYESVEGAGLFTSISTFYPGCELLNATKQADGHLKADGLYPVMAGCVLPNLLELVLSVTAENEGQVDYDLIP